MTNFAKINKPPAVENWSRMQHPSVAKTAVSLFRFMRGQMQWNYLPTRKAAKYHFEDGIDRETAMKIVGQTKHPTGRLYNMEATDALFDELERSPIVGLPAFADLVEWFPIGPGSVVPIKPLSVTRDGGSFVPYLLNPWSKIAFDEFQSSLFMSILEHSLFRITDFEDSPAKIVFLPKDQKSGVRKAVVWERGQFPIMTKQELDEQIRIFAESLPVAQQLYADYLRKKAEEDRTEP